MQRNTARVSAGGVVTFPNGTRVSCSNDAELTQWSVDGSTPISALLPAERDASRQWYRTLDALGIEERETLHADLRVPRGTGLVNRGLDEIVIQTAPPLSGTTLVLLYQDEAGGLSWHFPDRAPATGAPPTCTFRVSGRFAAAQIVLQAARDPTLPRGPLLKSGRKIFKLLTIPLSREGMSRPLASIERFPAGRVRAVSTDSYRSPVAEPFRDWKSLSGNRSLLMIHGALSSTEGMLSELPRKSMDELFGHYGGRVIALDHPTLSLTPEQNAKGFLEHIRQAMPDGRFQFDVLAHCRGGIVARTLAEQGDALVPGHHCTFRKAFFLGSPNGGSSFADAENLPHFVNLYSNLLANFQNGPMAYSLEEVLGLVMQAAAAPNVAVPGLVAMGTHGYVTDVLNRSREKSPAQYAAVSADYIPQRDRDNAYFLAESAGLGRTHPLYLSADGRRMTNDLVVTEKSVYGENLHPSFPLAYRHSLSSSEGTWHSGYLSRPETFSWMKRHFEIGSQAAAPVVVADEKKFRSAPPPQMRAPAPASPPPAAAASSSAGSSGAPPDEPATHLRRKPGMQFPQDVREGETHDLVVTLDEVAAGESASMSVPIAADAASVELDVTLFAPGFDVVLPESTRMVLLRERFADLERLVFKLTAQSPGTTPVEREIRADFWLRNTPVGSVTCRVRVLPTATAAAPPAAAAPGNGEVVVPLQARRDCEWVIGVDGDDDSGKPPLRLRLRSEILDQEYGYKKAGSLNFDSSISSYIETILESVFTAVPVNGTAADWDTWQQAFNVTLDGLGRGLWDRLPKEFRAEYFRLHDLRVAPQSILIHSDEMVLPWELMIPYDDAHTGLPPLGVAHMIGRWRTDMPMRPKRQRLQVTNFCVLNPCYPAPNTLPWSAAETAALKQRFARARSITPAKLADVLSNLLAQTDVQIVHFSGHGSYNAVNADLSTLVLEDTDLKALMIRGCKLMALAQPFVYMNACNAGQNGMAAGKCGGLAAIMLQCGSSGVVAPHWPVEDKSAMDFSIALYERLGLGRTIGEALQELRRNNPNNPTFRAFTYFGDPWVQVDLNAVA